MRYNVNWLALEVLVGGFCYLWIEPASMCYAKLTGCWLQVHIE